MTPPPGRPRAPILQAVAPAKLNLTLEVLGARDDSYHDIVSLVQTIDLVDHVEIRAAPQRAISFEYEDDDPERVVPERELISRAWDLLIEHCGIDDQAAVTVRKRIPLAAGLGGGSSDAAAFLRLARKWWEIPITEHAMLDLALAVGSDVPLFLTCGTLLVEGRGERVQALPDLPYDDDEWTALLWHPRLPLPVEKTGSMFRALQPDQYGNRAATQRLLDRLASGYAPRPEDLGCGFEPVADAMLLGLQEVRRRFEGAINATATLAGAGPSLFALGEPAALADGLARLRGDDGRGWLVHPLPRSVALVVRPPAPPPRAP